LPRMQQQQRDGESADKEVLFLIADYLARASTCSKTARVLQEEIREQNLLGDVVTWDGQKRPAEVRDLRGRFGEIAPDQLKRLLERGSLPDETEKTKSTKPKAAFSLINFFNARAVSLKDKGKLLTKLRDQERSAERELTRIKFMGPLQSRDGEENNNADADRTATKTAELTAPSSIIVKRRQELTRRLVTISSQVRSMRYNLRDNMLARSRKAVSVLDLVHGSQLGKRTEGELVLPSRELATSRLRVMKTVLGHRAYVYCVCADKTGRWIVTGSDDALLKLWNARTGELCMTFRGHETVICDVAIDKDSKYIASCSADKTVRLWELKSGRHIAVLKAHTKPINIVKFDPAENLIMSASDDGLCCIWDTERIIAEDERQINLMASNQRRVSQNASSQETHGSDQNPVVSAAALAAAGITNFVSPKVPLVLPHLSASNQLMDVNTMAVRPLGGIIATGCEDGVIRIWSIARKVPKRPAVVRTLPNLLASDYIDGAPRLLCSLEGHLGSIAVLSWSNKGDRLMSGSVSDGTVRVWSWLRRAEERAEAANFPEPTFDSSEPNFNVSPFQRVLGITNVNASTGYAGGATNTMDVQGAVPSTSIGRTRQAAGSNNLLRRPALDNCTWSRDDTFLITTQSVKRRRQWDSTEYVDLVEFFDQRIKIFNSSTGQLMHNICAHRKPALVLIAHPTDNHLFITGGHDGQICVWDVYTGKLLKKMYVPYQNGTVAILDAVVPAAGSSVSIAATDSGGRLVLIGTEEGALYKGAYPEQFFENDYSELLRDAAGNVLDGPTQLPCHQAGRTKVVDLHGIEYENQPLRMLRNRGSLTPEAQLSNLRERRKVVERLERDIYEREAAELKRLGSRFEEMEAMIAKANETEAEKQARLLATMSGSNSSLASRTGPVSSQGNERRSRGQRPMLACERATMERQNSAANSDEDSSGDEAAGGSGGDDGRASSRATRSAARRAQRHIRRFQELEHDPSPLNAGTLADSDSDNPDDVNWESHGRALGAVDMQDDDLDTESSDEAESDLEYGYRSRYREPRQGTRRSRREVRRSSRSMAGLEIRDEETEHQFAERVEREAIAAEQEAEARKQRRREEKQRQRSTTGRTNYDRAWLHQTNAMGIAGAYVPQLGDEVVFCVQGHRDYLRHFPISNAPAWRAQTWKKTWPTVCCKVVDLTYVLPSGTNDHTVEASVTLQVHSVPSARLLARELPLEPSEIWTPLEQSFELTVKYRPHILPEFMVFRERFEEALEKTWVPGERIKVLFGSESTGKIDAHPAVVSAVGQSDEEWPGSPWSTLTVDYETESERISMWEAAKRREDENELSLSKNKVLSRELAVSIAESIEQCIAQHEDLAAPFIEPVDLSEIPQYGAEVALPMDFHTILLRLENSYYRHPEAVLSDLDLIRTNCLQFNGEDSFFSEAIAALHPRCVRCVRTVLADAFPNLDIFARARGKRRARLDNQAGTEMDVDEEAEASKSVNLRELTRAMSEALAKFHRTDRFSWFAQPVDLVKHDDYKLLVAHPMDLGTIQTKLSNEDYGIRGKVQQVPEHVAASILRLFQDDVLLVCENSFKYNKDDSGPYKEAMKLLRVAQMTLSDIARKVLGISSWKVPQVDTQDDNNQADQAVTSSRRSRSVEQIVENISNSESESGSESESESEPESDSVSGSAGKRPISRRSKNNNKSPSRTRSNLRRGSTLTKMGESSDDEDYSDGESSSNSNHVTKTRGQANSRSKAKRRRREFYKGEETEEEDYVDGASEYDEEDHDNADDAVSDDGPAKRGNKRQQHRASSRVSKRARTSRRSRRSLQESDSDEHEEPSEASDDEEELPPKRSSRRRR